MVDPGGAPRPRRAVGLLLMFVLAGLCAGASPGAAGATLTRWDGAKVEPLDLAEGRPTVLVVIKGHWCPTCRAQLVSSALDLSRVQQVGQLHGISDEPWTTHREVRAALDLGYDMYSDPDGRWLRSVGMYPAGARHPSPGLVFLDGCGEVALIHKGRRPAQLQDDLIYQTLKALAARPNPCAQRS